MWQMRPTTCNIKFLLTQPRSLETWSHHTYHNFVYRIQASSKRFTPAKFLESITSATKLPNMTDANPPTGNAVNSSSLQNSSSSQHATIIPAPESHQTDPTSKHSPVRSTKSGWDGQLRIGDSQRTGQNSHDNEHGHGEEEEADDNDDDDSSSNDNESQAAQSQTLDSASLADTAATSVNDDDTNPAHLAHHHHHNNNNTAAPPRT